MEHRQVWPGVLWLCIGFLVAPARNPATQIPAAAGSRLRIQASQTSKAGIFYPEIRLYGPAGKKLKEEWAGSAISLLTEALPSEGTYTLLIGDYYGVYAGEYALVIERL